MEELNREDVRDIAQRAIVDMRVEYFSQGWEKGFAEAVQMMSRSEAKLKPSGIVVDLASMRQYVPHALKGRITQAGFALNRFADDMAELRRAAKEGKER